MGEWERHSVVREPMCSHSPTLPFRPDTPHKERHMIGQSPVRLVIATKNPGKVREFRALLAELPLEIEAADGMPDVDETGSTFAENAALKARAAAEWSGTWALADDSGIEVDALG